MDRQAKLSRLRFLVSELVEQLAEPQFDTPRQFDVIHWSDIVTAIEEIERRRSAVGVGPVLSVEVEGRVCGRVKAWRPSGRSVVESMIVHPSGGGPLWKALWDVLRQPEVVDNLRRWVRFIDHLMTQTVDAVLDATLTAELPSLNNRDVRILRRLATKVGVVLTQEDLMARDAANCDQKTVKDCLNHLMQADIGYVKRPEGKTRGYVITKSGVERLRIMDAEQIR